MKQSYDTQDFKPDIAKLFLSMGLGVQGGPLSTYKTTTLETGNILKPSEGEVILEPAAGKHGNNPRGFPHVG
jgi:hypothetical protein